MRNPEKMIAPAVLVLLLCGVFSGELRAQESRGLPDTGRVAVKELKDSIKFVAEDIRILQQILESSTIDRRLLLNTKVKSWVIANPELRDSLFYALMAVDSSLESEAGAEAEVLATPTDDILEIRFGTSVFKGMRLRDALAKSGDPFLYQRVAESHRYSKDVELRDPNFKIPTRFDPELTPYEELLEEFTPVVMHGNPEPERMRLDASLYGLIFKSGPTWGGEIRVGNDEVGLPFWSSGKTSFLATYKRIKFGFELPFQAGRFTSDLFPPFKLRGRKLNGSRGVVGEFDFGPAGGFFSISRLTDRDLSTLTDPNDFFYLNAIAQGYFSFGITLNPTNHVRVKVGGGYYRVREARVVQIPDDPTGSQFREQVQTLGETVYASPYVKFEYQNRDLREKFGGSFQYFDYNLMATAWIDLVPDLLRLELKYSWIVFRDLRKWENPDFIIISPRLRLSF